MSEPVRSVSRALSILTCLESATVDTGFRLVDLSSATALNTSTVYRLVQTLIGAGFVSEVSPDHYGPGPALIGLGRSAANIHSLGVIAAPVLKDIAQKLEATVYVSLRSSEVSVCIGLVHGSTRVRTLTLNVGDVRPLGVGAGSLAILSALPKEEQERLFPTLAQMASRWKGYSVDRLRQMVDEAVSNGFAFNNQMIISGVSGVGVPIFNSSHVPIGALSIANIESAFDQEWLELVIGRITDGADAIASSWAPLIGAKANFLHSEAVDQARWWWRDA